MTSNNPLRRSILRRNNEDSSGNDEAGGGKRLSVSFSTFKEIRYVDDNNKVRQEVEECQQLTPVSESNASDKNVNRQEGPGSSDDTLPWLKTLRTSFDLNDDLSPKQCFLSGSADFRKSGKPERSLFPENLDLTNPTGARQGGYVEPVDTYTGHFRWPRGSIGSESNGTTPGFPEARRASIGVGESDEELLDVIDDSSGSNYCTERFQNPRRKVLKRSLMSLAGGQPEYLKPNFRQSLLNRGSLTDEMKLPASILDSENVIPEGDENASEDYEGGAFASSPSSADITSPPSGESLQPTTSAESTPHITHKPNEGDAPEKEGVEDSHPEFHSPALSTDSASPPLSNFATRLLASPGIPERAVAKSRPTSQCGSVDSSVYRGEVSESLFAPGCNKSAPSTPQKERGELRNGGRQMCSSAVVDKDPAISDQSRHGDGCLSQVVPQIEDVTASEVEEETETNTQLNSGLARRVQDSLQRRRPSHVRAHSLSELSPSSPLCNQPTEGQIGSPPTLNHQSITSTPHSSVECLQQRKRISTPDFGESNPSSHVKKRRTSPETGEADHSSPPFMDCVNTWHSPSTANLQQASAAIPIDFTELPANAFLPSLKSPIKKAKELLSPILNRDPPRSQNVDTVPTLDLSLISHLEASQRVCGPEVLITPQTRVNTGHATAPRHTAHSTYAIRTLERLEPLKSLFSFLGLRELIIDIEKAQKELKIRVPPVAENEEDTKNDTWKSNLKELMENNGLMLHNITTNVSAVLASQIVEQQASIYSDKLTHLIDNCKLDFIESKLDGILAQGIRLFDGDRDATMEKFSEALKSQVYLLEFHLEKWWSRNFKKQIIDKTISLTNTHLEDIHDTLCSLSKQLDSRASELTHIQESLGKVVEDKKLSRELNMELAKSIKVLGCQEFQTRKRIELVRHKGLELEQELSKILAKQQAKREAIEVQRRRCERMEEILAILSEIKLKKQMTEMANGVCTMDSNVNEINLFISPHTRVFNLAATTDSRTSGSALGTVAEDVNRTRCMMRSIIPQFVGKLPLTEFLWHCVPGWILTFEPHTDSQLPSLKDISFRRQRRAEAREAQRRTDKDNACLAKHISLMESIVLHLKDCILWYLSRKAVISRKSDIPSWSWLCVNNVRPLVMELLEIKKLGDGDYSSDLIVNCEPSACANPTLDTKLYSWYADSDLQWQLRLYVSREVRGRRQLVCTDAQINVALAITSGSLLTSLVWSRFTEFTPVSETAKSVVPIPLPSECRKDMTMGEYIRWSLSI